MKSPRNVLITGASSGIGAALARAYAETGRTLFLTGRDRDRLDAVAIACRGTGAMVEAIVLEVRDRFATAGWIEAMERAHRLELVIANAGISGGTGGGGESEAQARHILTTNLDGVLNTIHPAIECMRRHAPLDGVRGQIAIMSSLAAFRGFPGAPAYCASKAAVKSYGESLRGVLAAEGIELSVICPGFVRSGMTESNRFVMPFLMDSNRAAAIIRRGLARNRARIAFPWPMYLAVSLLAALPPGLVDRALVRLPRKARDG
ncbi:MAG: SDR family NAD(P)-dependent oxidoreductase [Alphaproteobacteria bacterium]